MASETDSSNQAPIAQESTNSTNISIPLFLPFILGFSPPTQPTPGESRDRFVVINPLIQSVLVIEGAGGLPELEESLIRALSFQKSGPRPAAKSAIDAMPSVEIVEGGDEECVVCLEECEVGQMVKEMPCKHRFHGNCIENWLRINGSCPVCRHKMPVEEDEAGGKTRRENDEERRENDGERRGIWVRFDFGGDRRRSGNDQNNGSDNSAESADHRETES